MVNLRCSKCGSDSDFLIQTQDGKSLEIQGRLDVERIKRTVQVTCTYCNIFWDHVPVTYRNTVDADPFRRKIMH